MALDTDPRHVFRDFVTDGIPATGAHNPRKPEIRNLFAEWWQTLIALVANQTGLTLPNLLIRYTVTGGDNNAIEATPDLPVPTGAGTALFSILVADANTDNVTINGKPLLTSSGNQLVAGGLVSGIWLFLDDGASFRLASDQASQAIMDAAEQAAQSAQEARDIVENLASDAVSQGNVPIYSTLAAIASLEIPAGITAIRVNGRTEVGDGEGGLYIVTNNGSFDKGMSGDGRTWYRVALPIVEKWGLFADWQPIPDDAVDNDDNEQIQMTRNLMRVIARTNPDIDFAVFDGDLVDAASRGGTGAPPKYGYLDLIDDWQNLMPISWDRVFALPGNHDRDGSGIGQFEGSWSLLTYQEKIGRLYYHIRKGNIVQIFLGDMGGSNSGEILPFALQYLSDVLAAHKDCNVFIHTHQPMRGAFDSPLDGTFQAQSVELKEIIEAHDNIAAIFYGHIGATWELTTMHRYLHGTYHVNIQAGIPTAHGNGRGVPFSVMSLKRDAQSITIERWNGTTGERAPDRDVNLPLKYPIRLGRDKVFDFDGRSEKWWRDRVSVGPQEIYQSAASHRYLNGAEWHVRPDVSWLQTLSMGDDANDNIPIGTGVGFGVNLPGSDSTEGNDGWLDVTRPLYGFGGGISWARRYEQDTNYGSEFQVWARGNLASEPVKVMIGSPEHGVNILENGLTIGDLLSGSIGNANSDVVRLREDGLLANVGSASAAYLYRRSNGNVMQFYRAYGGSSTFVGSIAVTEAGTSFNQTSDAAFKKDNGELSFNDAKRIIELVKIHNFNWMGDYAEGREDIGVFAQELYEVYPRAVTVGGWFFEDGAKANERDAGAIYQPWAVDYSKLIPVMIRVLGTVLNFV